jgi:hypothetical protein
VTPTSNITINLAAATAGRRAIAGFLLQVLRSVKLGLDMSVDIASSGDGGQMRLHLEPAEGSDVQVVGGARDLVEQVKMRKGSGKWTTREVAAKVLPDLVRAVRLGTEQCFRFVTNNTAGLGPLQNYIDSRGSPGQQHRWGKAALSRGEFEERLAMAAGLGSVTPELRHLLDNLEIETIHVADTERAIEAALRPLLKPGEDAGDKRLQLMAQLMTLASDGAILSAADVQGLIHPDAHRLLAHIQSLPALLARHVEEDTQLIGYQPEAQARRVVPEIRTRFAILSGESGQGKTWTLAQFAFGQIERGELAVIMRSPTKLEEVVEFVNERIWQPAHATAATLSVIAKQLGDALRAADGVWLTIYIDDVQDRVFAERLARTKWGLLGIRTVVSCQPRITTVLRNVHSEAEVIPIGDFGAGDLRRYLDYHGGEDALVGMPDDVFELLLKPVHASIFVKLPDRQAWSGTSEYELFSAYWDYASLTARDQSDHPGDSSALKSLAGTLVDGKGRYPWRVPDLHAAGLDDPAILRLEQVGLLRRPTPDRILFATDRMLNWAVAEALSDRIGDGDLPAQDAEALLARVGDLQTRTKEVIGNRLGYVYFDAVWLLAQRCPPEFVADLMWEHVNRLPQEHRSEDHWRSGFGSIGAAIVPAFELLSRRAFDGDRDWDIPRNIPHALAAIAISDPQPVVALIGRQLASSSDEQVTIGLRTARLVSAPTALDAIWSEHLARERTFAEIQPGEDHDRAARNRWSDALYRRELSSEAIRQAIKADPDWLDRKLGVEVERVALDQLLWFLRDEDVVESEVAAKIWSRHRDRVVEAMPNPSDALIEVVGHFRDVSLAGVLDDVELGDEWRSDRVLASRARLDPQRALRQIAEGSDAHPWRASNWWFDELAAADAVGLSQAIRKRAGRGDDPLTDLILFYSSRPEAMDETTLEDVLDRFAARLREFNEAGEDPERHEGRLGHPLRFLPKLIEPWQFDALRRRAGTALEVELVRFATRRRGRTSLTRDTTGNDCELILAMIGGAGYGQLVIAELQRSDLFGRQDGYISASWTEEEDVRNALAATPLEPKNQTFGEVIRMEALSVHRLDVELETMVRAGAPVYVNAATSRSSPGRDLTALRAHVGELLAQDDPAALDTAAALSGFLDSEDDARRLVPMFTDPAATVELRRRVTGTFRTLSFYVPELLPSARGLLDGRIDDDARFVADYLAWFGDAAARKAVIDWLGSQDMGSNSTSRRSYLDALLEHADGKAAVIAFLRRSRANGHLVVEGRHLQLLAEDGDEWAQSELRRATYRYSGFQRGNAVLAIEELARTEPEEAYFAAQRLLTRHAVAVGADLMLIIDPERAGPELIERYCDAPPLLRLELRRRLRVRLGGQALADLVRPLATGHSARRRAAAAELSGAISPGISAPWLADLAGDGSPAVRKAARAASRDRGREAAAMAHRDLIPASPKPLQWARLRKVMELVDPFFLWVRRDPASLETMFEALPHEFLVDARKRRERLLMEREDIAKKADRKS